ncbi:phage tail protein [Lachnospiraceae bacterium 29-84]
MIEVSAEAIERVECILAGVPKGAERALSNAINRGLSRVKTGATKRVKEVYTVQSSAINEATNTKIQKASTGKLAGYIHFSGCKIPLYKFKVTPKAPGVKKQVTAAVKKGGGTAFENAFIAQMKSGHTGVFERETSKRLPVEEKMGLAMAQMVGNLNVMTEIEKEAQEVINERLEHEIERILNGYGG